MSEYSHFHDPSLQITTSRRGFLKGLVIGGGAVALASQFPETASAQARPASVEQWWPMKSGMRNDRGTLLHTLHEDNGPLEFHDEITGKNAKGWAKEWADYIIGTHPANSETWGYCHGVANRIACGINVSGLIDEGLVTALYAGVPVSSIRTEDVPSLIDRRLVVVQYPYGWFRVADRRVGNIINATNFGFDYKDIQVSSLVNAHIPYDGTQQVAQAAIERSAMWVNPNLDAEWVKSRLGI